VIDGRWLDDVDFAERFSIAKPVCPEWVGVHERVTFQEQVGDQLAHGGGLQKPWPENPVAYKKFLGVRALPISAL
jgi:hypothetical protein